MNATLKSIIVSLTLICFVNAIPPQHVFKQWQDASEEHIYIYVVSVEIDSSMINTSHYIDVKLDAVVDSIGWSKNNLNIEDTIRIEFHYYLTNFPVDTIINGNDTNVLWVMKMGPKWGQAHLLF